MFKEVSTKPKFIKVNDSNKIVLQIIFFIDNNLNDQIKNNLIKRLLITSNSKYKTNQEFRTHMRELSIIDYNLDIKYFVNKTAFIFNMAIPNEGLLEDYNMEACFEFLHDNIFNPYVTNEEFFEDNFNLEKDYLYNYKNNYLQNINNIIDEEGMKAINEIEKIYLTNEEKLNLIKLSSSKELYNYYKKNLKENSYITFIFGNLEYKNKIAKLYNKYFKQKNKKVILNIENFKSLKTVDYNLKSVHINYNETVLKLIYQIENLKEEELILLDTLYYFLNSRENNLVFDVLRNKHHLVYTSNVYENRKHGYIEMDVFLNQDDIGKAKKLITEVIENIKIETNFEIYKKRLLMALRYDIRSNHDNIYNHVRELILKNISDTYILKEKYKIIKNIDCKKMKSFLQRFKLIKEIIMIGDKDDKKNNSKK